MKNMSSYSAVPTNFTRDSCFIRTFIVIFIWNKNILRVLTAEAGEENVSNERKSRGGW